MKERVKRVFELISALSVSGNGVDLVAAARQELRCLLKDLEELEQEQERARRETEEEVMGRAADDGKQGQDQKA